MKSNDFSGHNKHMISDRKIAKNKDFFSKGYQPKPLNYGKANFFEPKNQNDANFMDIFITGGQNGFRPAPNATKVLTDF